MLVAALTMVGCATQEERAAREAAHMEKVKAAIGNQQYKIGIREMTPLRSSPINVSGIYYLKVNGNEVSTDLPYLGRDDVQRFKTRAERKFDREIIIRTQMENYNLTLLPKEKSGLITFSAKDGNDELKFNIQVSSGGQAKIILTPEGKDEIRYEGYVE